MRLFAFLLVMLVAGCAHTPLTHPRLTNEQALEIATTVAQKAGNHLEEYQAPRVIFDSDERKWSVYWDMKPPEPPGGYIRILVDDKTADARLLLSY